MYDLKSSKWHYISCLSSSCPCNLTPFLLNASFSFLKIKWARTKTHEWRMRAKVKSGVTQQEITPLIYCVTSTFPNRIFTFEIWRLMTPSDFLETLPMQHALTWANDKKFLASRHKRNVKGMSSLSFYVVLSSVKGILQKLQSSIICIGQRKTLI